MNGEDADKITREQIHSILRKQMIDGVILTLYAKFLMNEVSHAYDARRFSNFH